MLYGSYARGDFSQDSDVDMLILLDCSHEEVISYRKPITRIDSQIGLESDTMVSILLRDKQSLYESQRTLPFYKYIKEGVELYGKTN